MQYKAEITTEPKQNPNSHCLRQGRPIERTKRKSRKFYVRAWASVCVCVCVNESSRVNGEGIDTQHTYNRHKEYKPILLLNRNI